MNEYVKLLPKNKRYKQLIKEHGPLWLVVKRMGYVQALNGEGLFIQSKDGKHDRWVVPGDVAVV